MIPPKSNAEFVYRMEKVLAVYHRPYNPKHPVICLDESPNQLIGETRQTYITKNGEKRSDYEYVRKGTVSIFMACEPLGAKRYVEIKDTHKTRDWVKFVVMLMRQYQDTERITIVQDNLSTHKPAAFYEYFSPKEAETILDKIEWVFTPKHGSWLNIAEIELNVLKGQCLKRRIPDKHRMQEQINVWQKDRNNKVCKVDWQFTSQDARIKLKSLYPKVQY